MKMKNIFQIGAILFISGFIISVFKTSVANPNLNLEKLPQNIRQHPTINAPLVKIAIDPLSKFANRLNNNPISAQDEILIEKLAKKPIPIPKLISANAVLATGVNFVTKKIITLDPISGNSVLPCGKVTESGDNTIQICNTTIIDPPKTLRNAINITKPIEGKILKLGEKEPIDATFFVTVTYLYKGSDCTTTTSNGDGSEKCTKRPNRR